MSQVPERLCNVVAGVLDIEPGQVTPELSIGQIESWDSFAHLQIILALETEYGIQFDPGRIPKLATVALLQDELKSSGVTL
jgi:acyl carrier protein